MLKGGNKARSVMTVHLNTACYISAIVLSYEAFVVELRKGL
jgi:hypothetical protein